jgi:signal transduction histidine kinase
MGTAELWLATLPPEAPERRRVEIIFRASERAAGLVAQLLEFSRAEAPRFVGADLRAIVDRQVGLLRSASTADVPMTWAPPPDPLGAEVDEDQVCRLIAHLVSNAADAIRAKGSGAIEVSLAPAEVDEFEAKGLGLKHAGSFARVAVSDSGCGMDSTTLARAFDPFFTTKSVGKGTGLGLAVVQGVVAAHQGGIAIWSAPGEGTDVQVFLPVSGNVVAAEAPPVSAPAVA